MSPGFSLGTKRNQARKRGEKMKEDVGRGPKKEACQAQTGAEDHATQETLGLEDLPFTTCVTL